MTTLYITKKFTKGTLKGLVYNESVEFINEETAWNWAKGILKKGREGKIDYILDDYTFQKRRCDE